MDLDVIFVVVDVVMNGKGDMFFVIGFYILMSMEGVLWIVNLVRAFVVFDGVL